MSEIVEDIRQECAEYDRANPGWREDALERRKREFEKRKRELAETARHQQARKAREEQAASTNWYAAVDGRINEHLTVNRAPPEVVPARSIDPKAEHRR
jgi:hypothetical protein